jgi:acyl-homoserine lactone acylase PvdQ
MTPPTPEDQLPQSEQTIPHRRSAPPPNEPASPRAKLFKRLAIAVAIFAFVFLILTLTSAIVLRHAMHASLPEAEGLLDGTAAVPGLSAAVTVTRDAQGVPSIHASNLDDLLFAQGYITASDRLFQMDALRRHGSGELAELLGPSLLEHDREQRILQLRAAADRAITVLPPDQLHQLQAYANGVNAFIASTSTHQHSPTAHDLPVEFHLLHYTPASWAPRDSLLIAIVMSQDLSTSFPAKLDREALANHLPANLLPDLYPSGSWRDHPPTQTPTDLTTPTNPVEQIPLDNTQSSADGERFLSPHPKTPAARHNPLLAVRVGPVISTAAQRESVLATAARPEFVISTEAKPGSPTGVVRQVGWERSGETRSSANPADLVAVDKLLRAGLDIATNPTLAVRAGLCADCVPGSNNWAVAGTHTATGAPLLSNDMHLGLTAPDIWYEAGLHLDTPTNAASTPAVRAGLNVTGFTLPGVPFVIVGRNANVAWAFTNSGADVQDVLIEHLRGSGQQTEFEHPDGTWSPVGHQTEHIRVRAGSDVTLDVLTTTHTIGNTQITTPILSPLYKTEHRALALAWTVYDPSTITSPMYAINTATDASSLVAAFSGFGSVSQNLVYADAHHIGYHLLGRIPIRGPATQHPRAVQPFILPDATPSEDEDDESGDDPTASIDQKSLTPTAQNAPAQPPSPLPVGLSSGRDLPSPSPSPLPLPLPLQLPVLRRHPERSEGPPHLLRATFTLPASRTTRAAQRPHRKRPAPARIQLPSTAQDSTQVLPTAPTTPYTIGSRISPLPIDALDTSQIWSGYIPYDALPSVLDPASGILATANARIVTDDYPYFIANNWADAYRVERINHLLTTDITAHTNLTPADMLAIQTDTHSEFDLLVAQRLAYALDHSAITKKDPRLQQAANLLRDWNGDVAPNSAAAAIAAAARRALWPMLLIPKIRAQARTSTHSKRSPSAQELDEITGLYNWDEKDTALEQLLQHTPARWLPRTFPNWDDFLTTAVQRALKLDHAPSNLSTWTYGALHPVDIAHPVFGSHSPVSTLLGVDTGSGFHPTGGDGTTIKAAGLHFGPSERFTADLANPDNTHANITTGESGNPASPWFLDQFLPWLNGTTFLLPLSHPTTTHTLTLTPN